jgi:glycosyltransferase involved in cell wall biosynthesis
MTGARPVPVGTGTATGVGRVTVAVLTYLRTEPLRALLPVLARQVDALSPLLAEAEILVVDNDPCGSAEPVVRASGLPVRYVVEHQPGIAWARNRALDEASGSSVLVFIDDDELPHDGWLDNLVATYAQLRPAGVVGRVVPEFEVPLDPWLRAGFFRRPSMPTGTPVDVAATNNLLLDLHQVRAAGVRFDPEFGLTGGEDTLFTRSLRNAGGLLVWCQEAAVSEVVSAERATRGWMRRRVVRIGNSETRVRLALAPSGPRRFLVRLVMAASGGARIGGGAAREVRGVLASSIKDRALGRRTVWRGWGMLVGSLGSVVGEYGRG